MRQGGKRQYVVMGGHGGLNILPKKTWNVYNRENRLRVKRDEALAEKQKQQQIEQQNQADRDWRRETLLRKRKDINGQVDAQPEHENFFKQQEDALKSACQEESTEKETFDERFRFAGSCSRLREGTAKPWYAQAGTSFDHTTEISKCSLPTKIRREREEVEAARERKHKAPVGQTSRGDVVADDDDDGGGKHSNVNESEEVKDLSETHGIKLCDRDGDGTRYHKRRRHRKHRKQSSSIKDNKASSQQSVQVKSVEELRRERLEREQHERCRATKLLVEHHRSKRSAFPNQSSKGYYSSYGNAKPKQ